MCLYSENVRKNNVNVEIIQGDVKKKLPRMKEKFEKLLFQRPKIRGTHGYVKPDNKDLSKDLKSEYKIRKGMNGKEKYYSYTPVKKFLLSRVGQLWDKVHSEMSEHFYSNTGIFLMDAIKFFIEFHTFFDVISSSLRGISLGFL